jgi:hypothetical protein
MVLGAELKMNCAGGVQQKMANIRANYGRFRRKGFGVANADETARQRSEEGWGARPDGDSWRDELRAQNKQNRPLCRPWRLSLSKANETVRSVIYELDHLRVCETIRHLGTWCRRRTQTK